MRRTYKPLFWRATRPVNTVDCMNDWKYFLKYNINISIIIHFKQYLPSIIQSVEFTGRVARQNNGLYVLRMIVKLAYCKLYYLYKGLRDQLTHVVYVLKFVTLVYFKFLSYVTGGAPKVFVKSFGIQRILMVGRMVQPTLLNMRVKSVQKLPANSRHLTPVELQTDGQEFDATSVLIESPTVGHLI